MSAWVGTEVTLIAIAWLATVALFLGEMERAPEAP